MLHHECWGGRDNNLQTCCCCLESVQLAQSRRGLGRSITIHGNPGQSLLCSAVMAAEQTLANMYQITVNWLARPGWPCQLGLLLWSDLTAASSWLSFSTERVFITSMAGYKAKMNRELSDQCSWWMSMQWSLSKFSASFIENILLLRGLITKNDHYCNYTIHVWFKQQ